MPAIANYWINSSIDIKKLIWMTTEISKPIALYKDQIILVIVVN